MHEVYPVNSDLDRAWAAGLFEGEGCISFNRSDKSRKTRYFLPRITVTTTDEDVIRRFHAAVSVLGRIRGPIQHKKNQDKWKPYWTWEATGQDAITVMSKLLPLLGRRRHQRWAEITALMASNTPRRKPPPTCKKPGCDLPGYARGWCKLHYSRWRYRAQKDGTPVVDLRFDANKHLREEAERESSIL